MKLLLCGIPRSGSTLVWQIMKTLFPEQEIPQTHPDAEDRKWAEEGVVSITTIRHPCDVAASRFRVRISRGGEGVGNEAGLEAELAVMKMMFEGLEDVHKYDHRMLRYEDFYNDHHPIYEMVEDLGRTVPNKLRSEISVKYSAKANRQRAESLSSFNVFDDERIHGDHIGPVHPGSWLFLPNWQRKMIKEVCQPIADKWEYGI